jgi:hypothetical protein
MGVGMPCLGSRGEVRLGEGVQAVEGFGGSWPRIVPRISSMPERRSASASKGVFPVSNS